MHRRLHDQLNNIFNSTNYNHILLHGPKGSGKKYLIRKTLKISSLNNLEYDKLLYKKQNSVYFFDSYYINKYKKHFITFIKEICESDFDYKKHIIITNTELIQPHIFNFLRRFLEVNCENNKFIFICNSLRGSLEAIRSRCINLRVPYPSQEEYALFIKGFCKKSGVEYRTSFLKEKDIGKLQDIILLEHIGAEYVDNVQDFCSDIMENIKDYPKIQELVRNIIKNGFDSREVMKTFADYVYRQDVYRLVAEHDYKLALGYRELIHMESLFYQVHLLLK